MMLDNSILADKKSAFGEWMLMLYMSRNATLSDKDTFFVNAAIGDIARLRHFYHLVGAV